MKTNWIALCLVLLLASLSQASNDVLNQNHCTDDATSAPIVEQQADGTIVICSIVPAVYITEAAAQKAALKSNKKEAREVCPNGFRNLKPVEVVHAASAVSALSTIVCR